MKKGFFYLSFLVLFSSTRLLAIGFEAAGGLSPISPSGNIAYKGIALDLKNDLNYGKMNSLYGRVKVDLPLFFPNIYLMVTPMKFDGQGKKTASFRYGDLGFSADVSFDSTLKLDHYDGAFFYGVPALKTATAGKINVELGLNVRIIDFKTEIKQTVISSPTPFEQSKSLTLPVPMGYLALQLSPIDLLKLEGEFRGITYSSDHYYDLAGRVKIKAFKFLFVAGGYKYQTIKIDQNDVKTNLEFGGPLVEVGVEF